MRVGILVTIAFCKIIHFILKILYNYKLSNKNFTLKNGGIIVTEFYFSKHKVIIQNLLNVDFTGSEKYIEVVEKLDKLVTLADRLILASNKNPKFSNITMFYQSFQDAIENIGDQNKATGLLMNIEKWLKAVLYFTDTVKWEELSKEKKSFTLAPTIIALDMLTQQEFDSENYNELNDIVKQYIWYAKVQRNHETHNTDRPPSNVRNHYLLYALTTILVPLYLHYDVIMENLLGLIIRPVDKEVEDLVASINASRVEELKTFTARNDIVEGIVGKLTGELRENGGYYLLTGSEGSGKTAICAQISDQLKGEKKHLFQIDASILHSAPWLSGQLLHFGKWESDPINILRLLICQANTLLLEPIELPTREQFFNDFEQLTMYNEQSKIKYAISGEHFTNFTHKSFNENVDILNNKAFQDNVVKGPFSTQKNDVITSETESNELEEHKAILVKTLRKLTKEYGPIVLIIDALDEISNATENLSFLPRKLPEGVSALLTVRPNLGIEKWLTNYCRMSVYPNQLAPISREEIPQFTAINDYDGNEEKQFNNQVYEKSRGWSLQVAAIARKLKEVNGDFKVVDIDDGLSKYFERQKDEWFTAYKSVEEAEYLLKVLHMLAIIEPISAISLDDVQGYLEYQFNKQFNLDQIKNLLQPVAYQIQGLETTKKYIKLGIKAFAEHVKKGMGKRDLMRYLEEIVKWLKEDEYVELKLVAEFLNYWMNHGSNKEISIVSAIIDDLIEKDEKKRLKELSSWMVKGGNRHSRAYLYIIRVLAMANDRLGILSYAFYTLGNKDCKTSEKKDAETWLRKAAENEEIEAMRLLGIFLLQGEKLPHNPQEGEYWLQKAIEFGDEIASITLGSHLIEGEYIQKDINQGYQLLELVALKGNVKGIMILAIYLLKGEHLQHDPEKAKELLLKAADEMKLTDAMAILGSNLLRGEKLPQNKKEGEKWLRKAAEESHVDAMFELGIRLIYGFELTKNKELGLEWLENLCELGNAKAMLELAQLYIRGDVLPKNKEKGEELLIKATKLKSKEAMNSLAELYLVGKFGFPIDIDKGTKWFYTAIDHDCDEARTTLALYLIEGDILQRNSKQAITYLKEAVENKYLPAFNSLGIIYIEGKGSEKKRIEGEKLLRKGMKLGNNLAKLNLAKLLIEGEFLTCNLEEGKILLDELIEDKSPNALTIRIYYSLFENKFNEDIKEVKDLLYREIERDVPEAMEILSDFLVKGEFFERDVVEGERILQLACDKDFAPALQTYGKILIDGEYLVKDVTKGIKLLERADEKGNEDACHTLGYYYYKMENVEKAFEYYMKNYTRNEFISVNDMVYLIRRNEHPKHISFDLERFITILKKSSSPLEQVNYALYLLNSDGKTWKDVGEIENKTWQDVDRIFAQINELDDKIKAVKEWWYNLAKKGDKEGHLVLGLLLRHNKITDPDGLEIKERLSKLEKIVDLPHWIQKVIKIKSK